MMQINFFTKTILFVVFLALVGISIYGFDFNQKINETSQKEGDTKDKAANNIQKNNTSDDIFTLIEDKNNNNIADWEEELMQIIQKDDERNDKNELDKEGNNTLSSYVAKQLIEQYINKKEKEDSLKTDDIKDISSKIIQDLQAKIKSELPVFAKKDIKTFKPDATKITLYKKALKKAISDLSYIDDYELYLIAKYIQTKDKDLLNKIRKIGMYYETAYKNLIKVPAPLDIADEHLALINAFSAISYSLKNFPDYEKDPAKAYVLIAVFSAHEKIVINASKKLDEYFMRFR